MIFFAGKHALRTYVYRDMHNDDWKRTARARTLARDQFDDANWCRESIVKEDSNGTLRFGGGANDARFPTARQTNRRIAPVT